MGGLCRGGRGWWVWWVLLRHAHSETSLTGLLFDEHATHPIAPN